MVGELTFEVNLDALRVYMPSRFVEKADAYLGNALPRLQIKCSKVVHAIDIALLRCFSIALAGSLVRVRAPYAFPFLSDNICNEYVGKLHYYPGVDWIMLGGSLHSFLRLAVAHVLSNSTQIVELVPFNEIEGRLGQDTREGDVCVSIPRATYNYNQSEWENRLEDLVKLPEDEWRQLSANTMDMFPVYEPLIHRYLAKEPSFIVDFGCGLGQSTRTLATNFPKARVLGIDVSPQAIDVAQRKFKLRNLEFKVADISEDIGVDPSSVDLVVSTNALMYAKNQIEAAHYVLGLLRPDGLLLNNCRMGPSHSYWDFPRSLLLPTSFQLQPIDWIDTAAKLGFCTHVLPAPGALGFDSIYYFAHGLSSFREGLVDVKQFLQGNPPGEVDYCLSHAIMIHTKNAGNDKRLKFNTANHLREVENAVLSFVTNKDVVRVASMIGWLFCFNSLKLLPESVDFICACMPEAGPVVKLAFFKQSFRES